MTIFMSVQEIIMYTIAVLVVGLISYPISALLVRLNQKLIFALPIGFVALGIVLIVLGMFQGGWALFGYTIYGTFALLIGLGCFLGSLLLFFVKRKQQAK